MAPWPTAGSMTSGGRITAPAGISARRLRPASASRVASTSPASSLASRVPTLPLRLTTRRSGRRARSWAWRRNEALPITAPGGSASRAAPPRATSPPLEQRGLELLAEQPLAAEFGERPVGYPIAGGADHHHLERAGRGEPGIGGRQRTAGQQRLRPGERRAAGAETQAGRAAGHGSR